MNTSVEHAVAAIASGEVAIIPTDTVYGLATTAASTEATERLYAAKGRSIGQPTALMVASVEVLLDCLPELGGHQLAAAQALLPGPYTLVVSNPGRRYPWLCGPTLDLIGIRVPAVSGVAREILDRTRAIVATSANEPGGADPRAVADIAAALSARVVCIVDGGVLPGTPSTVIDISGAEPRVLREGAGDLAQAREVLAGAFRP